MPKSRRAEEAPFCRRHEKKEIRLVTAGLFFFVRQWPSVRSLRNVLTEYLTMDIMPYRRPPEVDPAGLSVAI
jgi:hypothetical protein